MAYNSDDEEMVPNGLVEVTFHAQGSVGEALLCYSSSTLLILHRCATWWACAQGCLLLTVHLVHRLLFPS